MARHFERTADKFGMDMTNLNREAARVAFEKLSAYNLADPDPGPLVEFWFYNHPALKKLVAFVEGFEKE